MAEQENDWDNNPLQEYEKDRKLNRQARKVKGRVDRSKYKVTDQRKEKFQERETLHENIKLGADELVKGRVLSINAQGVIVHDGSKEWLCHIRGLLKKEKTHSKRLVTVGDMVLFQPLADNEGSLLHVEPRRSVLARADALQQRQVQIIAANIDVVLITASVQSPILKPAIIDRYLIATRRGNMEPIVLINKIDLLAECSEEEKRLYHDYVKVLEAVGEKVIPLSVTTGQGLDQLKKELQGRATVFSGQSGVGKSSLINALTGLDFATGDMVARTRKGSHTTTTASLVALECGGWCIDTPGIKSFGVWDLSADEVESYFPEIEAIGHDCRFDDCRHMGEEGCAVREALDAQKILPVRYLSYLNILDSLVDPHRRR